MTSITVVRSKNGIYKQVICKGHAGYADAGSDIVCSAISMLVINTVNSLEALTETGFDVKTDEKSGTIELRLTAEPDAGGKLLLDSMVLGLEGVRKEYGAKYCKLQFKEV